MVFAQLFAHSVDLPDCLDALTFFFKMCRCNRQTPLLLHLILWTEIRCMADNGCGRIAPLTDESLLRVHLAEGQGNEGDLMSFEIRSD